MKKLDKYILKQFLGTFAFTLILILLISVVFDISEKIDDFYKREAPLDAIISEYYLNFIIHYGLLFSALFTFIAVIISTSKLANNSEIIAMINCGLSIKRLLKPYLLGATIIASISFYLNNWILPTTNQIRLDFEQEYIYSKKMNVIRTYIDKYNLTIIFISKVTTSTNKKAFALVMKFLKSNN